MAKEDEKKPTAADKGKAKAVNGDAEKKEVQKDKDGKPIDSKKDAPQAGRISESLNSVFGGTETDCVWQRSSARRTSS